MEHWAVKYVGREWKQNVYDCASLFVEVQTEEFGKTISIPVDRTGLDFGAMSVEIDQRKFSFAERTDKPVEGDGVLLLNGRDLNHIGIYCVIGNIPHVLHNVVRKGVCIHKLREIDKYNFKVEGFYKLKDVTQGRDDNINSQQASAITSG